MEQSNAAHLDPKLKEAYERVMGTDTQSQMQVNSPRPQTQVVSSKRGGGLSSILIFVGLILFFLIYAFVWTKIFNLKIPFLPF